MDVYSKRDIAEKLGRPVRTITYWTDFGLVIPDIRPSQGKGISRIYSKQNLLEFAIIDIMVKQMEIPLDTVQYIFKNLREKIDVTKSKKDWGESFESRFTAVPLKNFLTNPDWGPKKDLLYIEEKAIREPASTIAIYKWFCIVHERKEIGELLESNIINGNAQIFSSIIWLGKVKRMALKKLALIKP